MRRVPLYALLLVVGALMSSIRAQAKTLLPPGSPTPSTVQPEGLQDQISDLRNRLAKAEQKIAELQKSYSNHRHKYLHYIHGSSGAETIPKFVCKGAFKDNAVIPTDVCKAQPGYWTVVTPGSGPTKPGGDTNELTGTPE